MGAVAVENFSPDRGARDSGLDPIDRTWPRGPALRPVPPRAAVQRVPSARAVRGLVRWPKGRKRTNGTQALSLPLGLGWVSDTEIGRAAAVLRYACTVRVWVEMRLLRHGRTVWSGLRSVDSSQDGPAPDNGRRMTPWATGSRRGRRARAAVGGAAEQYMWSGGTGLGCICEQARSLGPSWAGGILAQLYSSAFLLYTLA